MVNQLTSETEFKLFMILLGSKAPGRHVEQHDYFFGIARQLKDLLPDIKAFWPEAGEKIHIDAWREVNTVNGYQVKVQPIAEATEPVDQAIQPQLNLFFVNLGGYQEHKFEEQHYTLLTVKESMAEASRAAKDTFFYQNNHFQGATSHLDDKYGIDVDDLYQVEDLLSDTQKLQFKIVLEPFEALEEDAIHLGYLKLSSLK